MRPSSDRPVFRKNELATTASGGRPPALRLCSLCAGIPVNTLTLYAGYDHHQSIKSLRFSAGASEYCHLCQMMWESVVGNTRFNMEGDPLLLESWPVKLYAIQADEGWSWRGYSAIELRSGDRSKSPDTTWSTTPTWLSPGVAGTTYPVVIRLYLYEGDDASPITYSSAVLDERSDTSIQQRKWWFHNCQYVHNHPSTDQPPILPTRVIDVDVTLPRPKLQVQSDPPAIASKYAALSYCWGKTKVTTTTSSNLAGHVSSGFELSSLPNTIQDAITITRELGLRYLWIDALCILQGTDIAARNDWDLESSHMATIYGCATVTIIAASSSSSDEGIFRTRRLIRTSKVALDGFLERKIWSAYRKLDSDLGLTGQYNVRAWTLQEMSLSTCALFFTQSMQYWKCSYGVVGEDGKQDKFTAVKSLTKEHVQRDWHAVVQEYSRRKLTNDEDKFPALSGLARIYNEGQQPGLYCAGLWQDTLVRDLLWRVELSEIPMPAVVKWRAPSWSWASTNEAIDCDLAVGAVGDQDYRAVMQPDVQVASVDPYGRLKDAKLTVHGKVKEVRRLIINAYHTAGDAVLDDLTVRAYVDKKKTWADAETVTEPCWALLLTRSRGLIIARVGSGPDVFKRIGAFMVTPRYEGHDLDLWRQDTVILI